MKRLRVLTAMALVFVGATARSSDPIEGTIETDTGHAEVLSKKLPIGKRIELPEGWFQVEEEGVEDQSVGSFTIAPARAPPSSEAETPPVAMVKEPTL